MKQKLWFKAKTYGWGWYPSTWQGWACIGIFILYIFAIEALFTKIIPKLTEEIALSLSLIQFLMILPGTILLILISYRKGEKPGWRWGKK